MLEKTSFIELSKRNRSQIVLFGSGNIAKKTLRKIDKSGVSFIADNSANLQGTTYEELPIKSPDEILKEHFIIICSTAVREISLQLIELGFEENVDFVISPVLNDLLAIQELENLSRVFYFTSGSVPETGETSGGGFYRCTVDRLNISIEKIYSGPCYGAIRFQEKILFIDTDKGIIALNEQQGNVEHLCKLPQGSRAHGISQNADNKNYYVTCSYLDAVLEIDHENFEILRKFRFSDKINRTNEPMHHCNDNWSIGNSLFVSMFSSTGQWKLDSFDGCIAEFDIATGARLGDVCTGLYMPHNVMVLEGSLHVLDSLPGHLRFNNLSVQGTFPAFTRGLAMDKGLYFIGQSKNRNYSKVLGLSNNISIDCGVIAFNPELKASRFIQFPYTIGEIHSVVF